MYKRCRSEQAAARQRRLEQGLLQLMKSKPYEQITICELCEKLHTPRKSFYRYFSSKDGALFALLDHTMLEFYTEGYRGSGGTPLGDLDRFFQFWYEHSALLDVLQRSHLSGLLVERATALALRERFVPRLFAGTSDDLQGAAVSFAICGLLSMVLNWHQQGYRVTPEEMTRIATAMLSRPLVPQEGL